MIAIVLSFFISTSAAAHLQDGHSLEMNHHRRSPTLRRLLRQTTELRKLQETAESSCTFEKLINKKCHLWEFCTDLTFQGNLEVRCGGNIDTNWYIYMEGEERCYNDLMDEEGFIRSGRSLPVSGFCSNEYGYLNFTGSELIASDVTEIITAPDEIKGTLHEVYGISECQHNDPSLADYYFGKSFCNDPCPYQLQVGGLDCAETCHPCSNGKMVLKCVEISPNLVERCEDTDNVYLYEEYFTYFQETNLLGVKSSSEQENSPDEIEASGAIVNEVPETSTAVREKVWMTVSMMILAMCIAHF